MRGLLIDLDGVLRQRDPAVVVNSERDACLPAGSIMAAAFEPDLLHSVVTGGITQEEWETEIIRVLSGRYPAADASTAVKQCHHRIAWWSTTRRRSQPPRQPPG